MFLRRFFKTSLKRFMSRFWTSCCLNYLYYKKKIAYITMFYIIIMSYIIYII